MLVQDLGVRTTMAGGGTDPAGIAGELLAQHRGLGGADVPGLRDAVAKLAAERPELGEAVRREVAQRLSVTDQAVFEGKPGADGLKPWIVDERRPASNLSELNYREAVYRQAVKENGGPFSNSPELEAAFAADRQRLERNSAQADAETNNFLYYGLAVPVVGGAGGAAAPIIGEMVGGQFVSATMGKVAYYVTSATVGGTTNTGLEAAKNGVFGTKGTTGAYVGAAVGGALGGTGFKLLGERAPALANNITLGTAAGGLGEFTAQSVDFSTGAAKGYDHVNTVVAGAIGAGVGAVTPLEVRINGLNSGRNSSTAIFEGLQTRLSNGSISQHRLQYGVQAGAGQATTGTAQGAVGAAITGAYQKATQ